MNSPFNQAGGNARVGWQSQYTHIDKLMAGPDECPEAKSEEGVANLNGRNPERARELIWQAIMGWEAAGGKNVAGEVLFYWLVAMLSGRTVRQFSEKEISQLLRFQSRSAEPAVGEWAAGVRLIYQLLDSALRPPGTRPRPDIDVSLLEKQFEDLGEDQRKPLLQLDLFLSGPRKDERWQGKLDDAKSQQHTNDRLNRAWVFFWPAPVEVNLPEPGTAAGGRRRMWFSALVFAVLASPFALELLWHDAALGLLGYVAALTGGVAVAAADLELRFYRERSRRQGEQSWLAGQDKNALNDVIDKRFQKYFDRYGPDEIACGLWKNASAGVRRLYREGYSKPHMSEKKNSPRAASNESR
jgi:hypothetical protein